MEPVATFSERLRELMGDKTGVEFAKEIGMSRQAVWAYLDGTRNPKRPLVLMIANQYHVDPLWLAGYDVPRRRPEEEQAAETQELVDTIQDRPDLKLLFKAAKNADPGQVQAITEMIQRFRNESPD